MSKADLAAKLWEMANLVTGFAIAQIVILIFSIVKGDFDKAFNSKYSHQIILIVILF